MRSTLSTGKMFHERFEPRRHRFVYPIFHLRIDLDEFIAGALDGIIARDRFGLVGVKTPNYLKHQRGNLREKVSATLFDAGFTSRPVEVELATMPAILGYVFNPVNVYLCYQSERKLQAVIVEVQNTFGETHIYVLDANDGPEFIFPKKFFVSPFFDISGDYKLILGDYSSDALDVSVELIKNNRTVFIASLSEKSGTLSRIALYRTILSMPGAVLLAMIRIHFQAFLIFLKRAALLQGWRRNEGGAATWSHQTPVHRARLALLNTFRCLERFYSKNELTKNKSENL